ncbi:putative ISBp1, transposase A [Bacteriovorax sp. BSW11_IV]|nr:putative ISBp1, transposase A [Bacteriovorax sp. BSW11_IV]
MLQHEGKTIDEVVKALEVNRLTYYRWKKEFGGLLLEQARRLKELEKENARLKKLVANQALNIDVLKELSKGNF